jgi:hypothetical protein
VAAVVVAGPSVSGGLRSAGVWVLGLAGGAFVGWFVRPADRRRRWHVMIDVALAAVAVALGVVAGYH